jgi:cytochrome c-type biogenesis protein CcmH/NrfF
LGKQLNTGVPNNHNNWMVWLFPLLIIVIVWYTCV